MFEVFKYWNLTKTIALTDFKLKYQGSVLGYLWSLVKPLMLFTVLYFVFTRVFRVGDAIPYYPVYLLLGIVLWNFFVETTVSCLYAIVGKGDLIRKVYFPRAALIISNSATAFMTFLGNLVVVGVFMAVNQVPLTWKVALVPLVFVELYVLVLGVSLLLSALYVRFRDIAHIWEVFLQAFFYATPILYAPDLVPETWRGLFMMSPMAQILQDFRYLVVTPDATTAASVLHSPAMLAVPYLIPVVVLVLGSIVFEKSAAKFAEEV